MAKIVILVAYLIGIGYTAYWVKAECKKETEDLMDSLVRLARNPFPVCLFAIVLWFFFLLVLSVWPIFVVLDMIGGIADLFKKKEE